MKIAAIPTKYAGIQFRSRLEARWFAFFDLLAWDPQYESVDLDGWIPDFVIPATHGARGPEPLLVEVKPLHALDGPECLSVRAKIDRAAPTYPVLLVGVQPRWRHDIFDMGQAFGVGRASLESGPVDGEGEALRDSAIVRWMYAYFEDFPRFPLGYDFKVDGRALPVADSGRRYPVFSKIEQLWREAGNRVQYKKPR